MMYLYNTRSRLPKWPGDKFIELIYYIFVEKKNKDIEYIHRNVLAT